MDTNNNINKNPYYTEQQVRNQPQQQLPPYLVKQQPYVANQPQQQQPYFSNPNNNSANNLYNPNPPIRPVHPPPQPYHVNESFPNIRLALPPPLTLTQCPFCRQPTPTFRQLRSGVFVWLMCLIIMMLTCCCWWIAFWVDSWKDTVFRCMRCGNVKYVKQGGC